MTTFPKQEYLNLTVECIYVEYTNLWLYSVLHGLRTRTWWQES